MGSIKIPRFLILILFFFTSISSGAQEAGTPLASVIRAIESVINTPEPENAAEEGARYEALSRLARLRQLSGDMEAAATAWIDAAAAVRGVRRESALVSGAFCLAAIGEWEKATTLIAPVLSGNRQGPVLRHARYLEACARAWTGGGADDLVSLAQNQEYAELHSSLYYTLWRLGGLRPELPDAESAFAWKTRLLEEFPRSPEGRIAASEAAGRQAVAAKASLHWLLIPGFDLTGEEPRAAAQGVPAQPPAAQASPPTEKAPAQATSAPAVSAPAIPAAPTAQAAAVPAAPPAPAPAVQPTPAASPAAAAQPPQSSSPAAQATLPPQSSSAEQNAQASTGGRVLQTGLFGVEANAISQMEKLIKAGFSAAIIRRNVNGKEFWAVTVPAGSNINSTIENLKKAGFDSFPL